MRKHSTFSEFRSFGFRSAGFAWTSRIRSNFQVCRHSGRSARGCRKGGFSTSHAAFSRFVVLLWQARAESRNPGFGEFSKNVARRNVRLSKFGQPKPTFGRRALVSRQDAAACGPGIYSVRRRAAGLRTDTWIPALRALSSATPPNFNRHPCRRGFLARLGKRALRLE